MPIQIPVGAEDQVQGHRRSGGDEGRICGATKRWAPNSTSWTFPRTWSRQAKTYREQMIEAVSEFDDALFEKFVDGEALTNDEITRRHPQGDHRA